MSPWIVDLVGSSEPKPSKIFTVLVSSPPARPSKISGMSISLQEWVRNDQTGAGLLLLT